jgi:hypothetical protein
VTGELLSFALAKKDGDEIKLCFWHTLSNREQQVAVGIQSDARPGVAQPARNNDHG